MLLSTSGAASIRTWCTCIDVDAPLISGSPSSWCRLEADVFAGGQWLIACAASRKCVLVPNSPALAAWLAAWGALELLEVLWGVLLLLLWVFLC